MAYTVFTPDTANGDISFSDAERVAVSGDGHLHLFDSQKNVVAFFPPGHWDRVERQT